MDINQYNSEKVRITAKIKGDFDTYNWSLRELTKIDRYLQKITR